MNKLVTANNGVLIVALISFYAVWIGSHELFFLAIGAAGISWIVNAVDEALVGHAAEGNWDAYEKARKGRFALFLVAVGLILFAYLWILADVLEKISG